MASDFDRALRALYQGPRESFIAERQRLAAELKANGDRESAARLAKRPRPSLSAWIVNQLWWRSPHSFERLFETAEALRAGKLDQAGDHRRVVAELNSLAQTLLREQGHGNGDATSRRVTMTLAALAASGGFEPDPPGTLSQDRDPPGFEAFGIDNSTEPRSAAHQAGAAERESAKGSSPRSHSASAPQKKPSKAQAAAQASHVRDSAKEAARRAHEAAQERARAAREEAERSRAAEAAARARAELRAKRAAERREREHALAQLEKELTKREHDHSRLLEALEDADRKREQTLQRVVAARAKLAELNDDE